MTHQAAIDIRESGVIIHAKPMDATYLPMDCAAAVTRCEDIRGFRPTHELRSYESPALDGVFIDDSDPNTKLSICAYIMVVV